jgi:hypothetical protein
LINYFVGHQPVESSSSESKETGKKSSRQPKPSGSSKGTKGTRSPVTKKHGVTSKLID